MAQHARPGPLGCEAAAAARVAPGEVVPSEAALGFLHQLVMHHQVRSSGPACAAMRCPARRHVGLWFQVHAAQL